MKVGIGKHNDDKDISLTTRGLKTALGVEILDASGSQITTFPSGLSIPEHDYISLSYDSSSNLTGVIYKTGGSSGITVATLTLAYSGSNLVSVTKS